MSNVNTQNAYKTFDELTAKSVEADEQAAVANIKSPSSKLPRPGVNATNNTKLSNDETKKFEEQAGVASNKTTSKIPKPGVYGLRVDRSSIETTVKVEEQPSLDETKALAIPKPVVISTKLRKASTEKIMEIEERTGGEKSKPLSKLPKLRVSSAKTVKNSIEECTELTEEPETASPKPTQASTPIKSPFASQIARFPISPPRLAQPYFATIGAVNLQDPNFCPTQHPGSKIPTRNHLINVTPNGTTSSPPKTLSPSFIPTKVEDKKKNEINGFPEELDVSSLH